MTGYLYIITNDAFPGWVKIGTTTDFNKRIHTYQTGDPLRRYKVIYVIQHPKFREAEKKIKDTMKHFALEIKNEWYKVDLKIAKSRLDEQLEEYELLT
jgi:predicted GIY-YIG superfamily endonuclease